jgi:ppGpp synthetase/RelA/SpoT-type nucleotidyltranferase
VIDLEAARGRWLSERGIYEELLQRVIATLKHRLRLEGMSAHVTARTKDTPNLLKKMLKKGYGYERITDKAAARVVVQFRYETEAVLRLVENSFDILRKEDKAQALGHSRVGYSGVHYDVRLKTSSLRPENTDLTELQCEIQVHTLCQNLWAEMDHQLGYKPAQPIPEDLVRQIYLLNALLEVTDRNFTSISLQIAKLPGADAMRLLQNLERHFYRFTGETFDPGLSRQILEDVMSSYESAELPKVSSIVESFVEVNASRLQSLFNTYEKIDDRPLLLFQPESFVLLERLETNPHVLEAVWIQRYPREELERLSIAWGKPLD